MKQLRLFERPGIDLLAKLKKESDTGENTNYRWNGESW